MPRLNRYDRQSPMDYLITAQSSINGLFDFLKSNSINYNGRDFYNRKDWDIKITQRTNTSTIAASNELETSASYQKQSSSETTVNINYNYGNLYNWYAVSGGTLAPTGYRVPSDADMVKLTAYIGDYTNGYKLKATGTTFWDSPNAGATNIFGFFGIPTGRMRVGVNPGETNYFADSGSTSYIWTSTSVDPTNAKSRSLYSSIGQIGTQTVPKGQGESVRCLRDTGGTENILSDGTYLEDVQDIDGNWYKTVKIGTQVWMTQNLKTTKYNDGSSIPNVTGSTEWISLTTDAYCTYNNQPLSTYEDPTYYYSTTQTTYTKGFSKSFDIKTE